MRIKLLTLFPEMFAPLSASILGRAEKAGLLSLEPIDIRAFTKDKHRRCDDSPFGGGPGMVLTAQPLHDALLHATRGFAARRVLLSPKGRTLTQKRATELAKEEGLILICGHYEGIDQRAIDLWVDEEISIGDYVLTGGELAAMVLIDALARHIPGVLGDGASASEESFMEGLLEYPHYTRPAEFLGLSAPEELLSGAHKRIESWRREKMLTETREKRPDLFAGLELSFDDRVLLGLEEKRRRRSQNREANEE
ncbi:MAG: tRNA (guanosine(37)-N1)-methyltransferase TrmD [Christensenellaceae bacterium]|jgi:tRNA (guanine37-N1)-methyltransferase|nr:tRNA (guanosine(37)-N1)-methyltransferase TrmD [Christensenellaceae bacterium]